MYILLVAAVPLTGCASESEPELSESLVGIWQEEREGGYEGAYVEYREDGTYDVGYAPGQGAAEWGTWSADQSVVTAEAAADSRHCAGMVMRMDVTVLEDGDRLESTVLSNECDDGDEDDLGTIVLVRYTEDGS